jgi:hypothetical protein
VSAGDCRSIGTFARGNFYAMAYSFSRRVFWPSEQYQAKTFCIPNQQFTVLLYDGYQCYGYRRGFVEIKVAESEHTWTLDPVPWTYAAIAAGGIGDGAWGYSGTGHASREDAEQEAMRWCSQSAIGCRVVGWARSDMCLALATGNDGNGDSVWGWASRPNMYDARSAAREACQGSGAACLIKEESCAP